MAEIVGYRIWVFDPVTHAWGLWGTKVWTDEGVARSFASERITKRRWEIRPKVRTVRARRF